MRWTCQEGVGRWAAVTDTVLVAPIGDYIEES